MTSDPHDLNRFLEAQQRDYARAMSELRQGRKLTHWMWYIFPQLDGLGFSPTARKYAIRDLDEARAYLDHPVLGPRLVACVETLLGLRERSAEAIFGFPDVWKLRSCATLFACVSPKGSVFERLLDQYYQGEQDDKTLNLLGFTESKP